jgi:hypothetical protein
MNMTREQDHRPASDRDVIEEVRADLAQLGWTEVAYWSKEVQDGH